MKTIRIYCVGVSPLLMDPMTEATLEGLRTGVHKAKQKDVPAEKVAAEKIYRDEENGRHIGLPQEALFACLVNAGRNVKLGKKQVSTASTTTLPDFMSIEEMFIPFTNIDPKNEQVSWRVDKRRGRLKDGTAVCVVRPRFDHWEFAVTITFDEGKIAESKIVDELFGNAGSAQGLGSFRPNCKGPFGRFKVVKVEEVQKAIAA